jgi:hypothetical protein
MDSAVTNVTVPIDVPFCGLRTGPSDWTALVVIVALVAIAWGLAVWLRKRRSSRHPSS